MQGSFIWQKSNSYGEVIKSGGHGLPGSPVPTPMIQCVAIKSLYR